MNWFLIKLFVCFKAKNKAIGDRAKNQKRKIADIGNRDKVIYIANEIENKSDEQRGDDDLRIIQWSSHFFPPKEASLRFVFLNKISVNNKRITPEIVKNRVCRLDDPVLGSNFLS